MPKQRNLERVPLYEMDTYKRNLRVLAENLRRVRERRGWTQEDAAAACELAPRFLQAIENSKRNVTLLTLTRISEGFGVAVPDLLAPKASASASRDRAVANKRGVGGTTRRRR